MANNLDIIDQILWGPDGPPPEAEPGTPARRITFNVSHRTYRALDVAIALRPQTKTEVLNGGAQLYAYVMKLQANGGGIWIQDSGKSKATDLWKLHIL